MQSLDLKTKDLKSDKFTYLKSKLKVQKYMHIAQRKWIAFKKIPRAEALIFDAWNSLPECYIEMKKRAYGVLTIFRSSPGESPRLVPNIRISVSAEYRYGLCTAESSIVESIPCHPK
ncbi:dimer_Tnp_hAT domain-containing protein [Trichonephila clavipes]|nr:dimer_Tnp_hAT domain-containing protein [Trichonephila clavipes]